MKQRGAISFQLWYPIMVVLWRATVVLWTAMPEAAVHHDRYLGADKCEIGRSREVGMEPVAIALSPERTAKQHFRLGILFSNPVHLAHSASNH
jgi:hypothetical protein